MLPGKPILTNRELKNKITGIDLYVSDYQEIPHRLKNTFPYHVIVVTNLFYYKDEEHRESDVVQFMISKSFEEFEDLYGKLFKRFPSVIFPPLPSKSLLSSNVNEKLQCMDKVLQMVAATQKLCCSKMVLSFIKGGKKEVTQQDKTEKEIQAPRSYHAGGCEDVDLFQSLPEKKVENEHASILSTDDKLFVGTDDVSLFEEDSNDTIEDDVLFSSSKVMDMNSRVDSNEFEQKLLSSTDVVDELLDLRKSSKKQPSIKSQIITVSTRQKTSGGNDINLFADEPVREIDMFKKARTQSLTRKNDVDGILDVFEKRTESSLFDNDDSSLFSYDGIEGMEKKDILDYIHHQINSDIKTD